MNPKTPGWLFLAGGFLLIVSMETKRFCPDTLGRILPLQWGCGLMGAILFSMSLFTSLYGFFGVGPKKGIFLLWAVADLLFLLGLLSLYFSIYVVFSKAESTYQDQDVLPTLIENARTLRTEKLRFNVARGAFLIYGAKIPYQRDDGGLTYFEPSANDISLRHWGEKAERTKAQIRDLCEGQLWQAPYLFGLTVGAIFVTFTVASLWLWLTQDAPPA